MATESLTLLFGFMLIIIISLSIPLILAVPSNPRKLVLNLIHRHSIHSPYHNKNKDEKLRRSLPSPNGEDFEADLYSNKGLFLVNFSIGQPPVSQMAIMDTGSSLLWVQSGPFRFPQCLNLSPRYDYKKSSTFTPLTCTSEYCDLDEQPENVSCTNSFPCFYKTTYVQSVDSRGHLGTEQLMFRTSDGGLAFLDDVVFGCGRPKRKLEMQGQVVTGVFGLGFRKTSLARRLAKFSYCVGSVSDPNYAHNKLIFGDESGNEGESTPLYLIDDFYHVVLEGISVGETRLSIDPNAFKWNGEEERGVILDSGSPATWLIKELYEPLLQQVQSLADTFLTKIPNERTYLVCYKGTIEQELEGFPTFTFHFEGGAELVLDAKSSFFQEKPDEFCLALLPSYAKTGIGDQTIVGLLAQQNYNVAYDLDGKKVSFRRIECELLED